MDRSEKRLVWVAGVFVVLAVLAGAMMVRSGLTKLERGSAGWSTMVPPVTAPL